MELSGLAIEKTVARAEAVGFAPELLGLEVAGAAEWRGVLASAPRERVQEIVAALDERLARVERDRDDEERAARQRRIAEVLNGAPLTPDEQRLANEANAPIIAAHKRYVEERPARVEVLLTEIRDALRGLATR